MMCSALAGLQDRRTAEVAQQRGPSLLQSCLLRRQPDLAPCPKACACWAQTGCWMARAVQCLCSSRLSWLQWSVAWCCCQRESWAAAHLRHREPQPSGHRHLLALVAPYHSPLHAAAPLPGARPLQLQAHDTSLAT